MKRYVNSVCCLLFWFFLAAPCLVFAQRLQPSDLVYQGAFRLPESFNWGARGLSYYPAGEGGAGSLLVTGFEGLLNASENPCEGPSGCQAYYGEVTIPAPVTEANWENLPVANFIRFMTPFDGGLIQSLNTNYVFVSGIQYVPWQGNQESDKIYGSLNAWYPEGDFGDDTFPTVWFSGFDGSGARGLFFVGPSTAPYHGRKMGDYLFSVPQWYADLYLRGRTLVTGRARGTPVGDHPENTTEGGSQGPTLFAFKPWQTDTPDSKAFLDAIPMLYYRTKYPGCAGPDIGVGGDPVDCDYPGFSMCDVWNGAGFVENGTKSAVLILGHKGSTNCYHCGDPEDDSGCNTSPLPGECDLFCGESRGYHCGPYQRQVIFYDTTQLGEAAQGTRDPWSVLPYATWQPENFYLKPDGQENVCEDVGGLAVDNGGRRVFMVERGLGSDNGAVVHVWSYAASPCPGCSGDPVVLKDVTFPSGIDCECTAVSSVTIGTGVIIMSGARVIIKAPVVQIEAGFTIQAGAQVQITQ